LQELSNRGEGASVSVGGIVIGQYSCQPFRISSQLWVQDGEETVSRLKSTGFDSGVFPLNNHGDVQVFQEMRSQLNLLSWANCLVDTNPDRISRYLNYLSNYKKISL
jgi:DNA polymerase III subunit alpha